jgi:hypothetical protein
VAEDPDERQIELYLLGALPEAEIERLDELSLTDDRFSDRLSAVENDLVDAYAQGELPVDRLEGFQSHYLASPRRRDKVRIGGALVEFGASAAATAARDEPASGPERAVTGRSTFPRSRRRDWFGAPRLGWAFAMAGLVVLVAAGYLGVENRRLRGQIAQAQQERATLTQREKELERQIEDNRSEGTKTADELARVRERLGQLEQQAATGQHVKPEGGGRDLAVVAFTLAPPTRGASPIRTLALPAGAGIVALGLELESDDLPEYRATLKNPATNQVIWQSAGLKPTPTGQNKTISIKLRAGLLKPGIYNVELKGIQKGGNPEIIGTYSFRVVIE